MKSKVMVLIAVMFAILIAATTHAKGPWRGKVIDAETKQPIEGAAVVALWYKEFDLSPAGGNKTYLDAQETVTDKNGDFEIPSKYFVSIPFIREVWPPEFTIFKPGYGSFPSSQKSPIETPEDYFLNKRGIVELPRLTRRDERLNSLDDATGLIIIEVPRKKVRYFFKLSNEESMALGIPGYPEVK